MNTLPEQALPLFEKNEEWRRNTVEAYVQKAVFNQGLIAHQDHILKLYDFYNGIIDDKDYSFVLEPYGKARSNFPAKIRNYNIIKPNVDLLLGEKSKRPFNFTLVVSDPDVVSIREEMKNEAIKENIYQWFVNKLNEEGLDTGMESEEVELPEKIAEMFERNWKDNRAMMAENALRFLIPYLHISDKLQKLWFDFIVSGYVFSEKGVENKELFYNCLNPVDTDYDKDPELDFIEDGEWAATRKVVLRSTLVDMFHRQFGDDKKMLERLRNPTNSNTDGFNSPVNRNVFTEDNKYVEWITVYWKSLKRVGIINYTDEFGDVIEEVVEEEEYNEAQHPEIEWVWINEVWKGHRIDGDIYLDIKPVPVQRGSIDNPSKCKLPINGRLYSDRNSRNISLVELGIPYQLTYNIFKFRLENAIGKSKDILAIFDINMIPEGWDMDKWMQMVDASGIAWQDYAKEGINMNPQHRAVIDLSIKTIGQYIDLLRFIVEEWERLSGITRQRQGSTSAYEGKAVTEQSIIQSSHITEDYYRKFEKFEQLELQGLLDYSQLAFIDGKKGMYVMPDGATKYFETDIEFSLTEYGLYLSNSAEEQEKISFLKQLGQSAIQNGASMSLIAEIINGDSFTSILQKIKEVEANMQEMQEQAQQMEQEIQQQQMEVEAAKMEHDSVENEKDRQNKIEIELIKQSAQNVETSTTNLDERKQELAERKIELDKQIKERQLREQERSNRANEDLKRKQINKPTTKK